MKLSMTIAVTIFTLILAATVHAKDHRGERDYRAQSGDQHHRGSSHRRYDRAKNYHSGRHHGNHIGAALLLGSFLNYAIDDNHPYGNHQYDNRYSRYGFHYRDDHGRYRNGHRHHYDSKHSSKHHGKHSIKHRKHRGH